MTNYGELDPRPWLHRHSLSLLSHFLDLEIPALHANRLPCIATICAAVTTSSSTNPHAVPDFRIRTLQVYQTHP